MSFYKNDHVITCPGIILWDGITKPEIDEKDGSLTHNLRVAIPNNAPELAELLQIANLALTNSEFKGVLPPGANWPVVAADPAKFGPTLAGYTAFTAKTRRGVPGVFDLNGQELTPIMFGRSFYPGAKVSLIVHAYAYNNKQKGVAFGLDGIQIVDATAPALAIGGGIAPQEVANAFGAAGTVAPPPPAPPAPPAPAAPVVPHTAILAGPQMTALAGATTYQAYRDNGWSDEQLITAGYMLASVPAPLPPVGSAPPPPPPAPIAPAAGPQAKMLPAAGATTYQAYRDNGWTDAQLVQNGFMAA